MELESGTETDHQPVMRHAEAVSAAARLSILGALRDWWVDNVMRAKKGGGRTLWSVKKRLLRTIQLLNERACAHPCRGCRSWQQTQNH